MDIKYFSVGHRCSTTQLLIDCGIRCESHPFDWLVSKLDVVQHSLLDDFKEFLNTSNYEFIVSKVDNIIDDVRTNVACPNGLGIYKNKYYSNSQTDIFNELKLATYYKDKLFQDDYYQRCVERFKKLLMSENNKVFAYIHPIMGINDYTSNLQMLLKNFENFKKIMDTKTTNLKGKYFIIVKMNNPYFKTYDKYINKDINIVVYTIYTNNNFLDAGKPFKGDFEKEYNLMKQLFLSDEL
jgi:hypothetical protein